MDLMESLSQSADLPKKGRWAAASDLVDCFATTTGKRHKIDDFYFWTLRGWGCSEA